MPSVAWRCALPLVAALVLLGSVGCGSEADGTSSGLREPYVDSGNTRAHRLMNLVGRADTLSVLTRALRQSGLAKELRLRGPYTLFAPTDRAFQRRWPGFDSLLAPVGTTATAPPPARQSPSEEPGTASQNRDTLRQVLRFHLVRGRFTAADLADSLRLGTLANESLLLKRAPRNRKQLRVHVKGTPDPIPIRRTLEAQNGVLHILQRPLRIPPPDTSAQGALSDTTNASPAQGTD